MSGGIVDCEVAAMLLEYNNSVTIIAMLPDIVTNLEESHKADLMCLFNSNYITIKVNPSVTNITNNSVSYNLEEKEETIEVDKTILFVG